MSTESTAQGRCLNALDAGRVDRFHCAPSCRAQTVGLHTYGVLQIVRYLWAERGTPRAELLLACMEHDTEELFLGDLPFTIKRAKPAFKKFLTELEDEVREYQLPATTELTDPEYVVLKLADMLEGFRWTFDNEDGWVVHTRWLTAIEQKLSELLTDFKEYKDIISAAKHLMRVMQAQHNERHTQPPWPSK